MRLNTTKTFANFLQKEMRKKGLKYDITLEKLNEVQYAANVDCMSRTSAYDWLTGLYSVLKITYPYNYYACPKYITKEELCKLWHKNGANLAGFLSGVYDYIAI